VMLNLLLVLHTKDRARLLYSNTPAALILGWALMKCPRGL
jgi:hypothetical protein